MTQKAAKAPAPNLKALEDSYEIVGELRGSAASRGFLGKRRSDGTDVVITVVRAPSDGGDNALSHYAADVKLLAELEHPHVVRVIEAKWIGNDALAVVSERADGDSLDAMLDRGEQLSNPRIAAVLQAVFGALEWARASGVVHRGVYPEGLFFEEGTQRVVVALAPAPIPITGGSDESSDAQTIGALAWTMLTGKPYDRNARDVRLASLAPNLAQRVIDATERLVGAKRGESRPDVPSVVSIIAAGDVLKQAEVEIVAMKEEYQEQHRAEIARCEAQRLEVEQNAAEAAAKLADERAAWGKEVSEKDAAFTEAQADFDRIMSERKSQLADIRAELENQASELERRLAEFDDRRSDFERAAVEWRKDQSATPSAPKVVKSSGGKKRQKPKQVRSVFAPLDVPPSGGASSSTARRRWMIPAGAAGLVLVIVASVFGIRHFGATQTADSIRLGKTIIHPNAPVIDSRGLSRGGFLSQSAAGKLAPKAFGAPGNTSRDSLATPPSTPVVEIPEPAAEAPPPRPKRKPESEQPSYTSGREAPPPAIEARSDTVTRRDSTVRADSQFAVDTTIIRDTSTTRREPMPRRDSMPLRDSTLRRDSVPRRDSIARPDSLGRVDSIVKTGSGIRVDTVRIRGGVPVPP